ncbi:hypothetical protein O7623_00025 [Solwaraspora sp. WMMD791]|uniref:hypothetical protein n=1 Tax=Solwaraspora sp. WMMD791 TaxID=3016086 RepID=UPI00249C9869|nr:hypothetical protein [Solwaraspora sp. WMMD791]WFE27636.1 hypothetical protein O7623_31260 [Solwaraspora sp. WMMD791]WFE27649.1 hypothetical protein O7623_00025 [Solwaraspora sp. WMMD791]
MPSYHPHPGHSIRATEPGTPTGRTGEPLYCRRCRRGVNVRFNPHGVIVEYLHAAEQRGERSDHKAEPVPVTEIPDPIIECDFCSAPDATWIYQCANQLTDVRRVTAQVVAVSDYRNRHHAARVRRTGTEHALTQAWGERWSACDGCADLIETRDIYGLIQRVTDAMPAKMVRGKHLARTRALLHDTYSTVFDTLAPGRGQITPGNPLGIWPEAPEAAS